MSNNRNRRASTPPSGGESPVTSLRDLREMVGFDGWTVETSKRNVGEWNEGTNYVAVKGDKNVLLDNPGKGERRNWQDMYNYFKTKDTEG